jgi:hypothetical protein
LLPSDFVLFASLLLHLDHQSALLGRLAPGRILALSLQLHLLLLLTLQPHRFLGVGSDSGSGFFFATTTRQSFLSLTTLLGLVLRQCLS